VLIYKSNGTAERDALPNANSLGGYEFIDYVKSLVEKECPKTVSCADIIALSAREAVKAVSKSAQELLQN
jgi:peroxidase